MTIDERLHIIGEFIRRSYEEFDDGGNNLIAAELLWGAVAHGLIAIAEINGWRCEGHRGYQAVSVQLDEHSPPGPWAIRYRSRRATSRPLLPRPLGPGRTSQSPHSRQARHQPAVPMIG